MMIMSIIIFGLTMVEVDNTVRRMKLADTHEDTTFSPGIIQNANVIHAALLPYPYQDTDLPLLAFASRMQICFPSPSAPCTNPV